MSLITESQLLNYQRSSKSIYLNLNESLNNFKNESSTLKTTVFLSHKHDERAKLEGAISFLKQFGVDIYVDWLDEGMPKTTSGTTAVRIKDKIRQNHKFILLATEAAINSKWCNWELGLGDAAKYVNNIAIFPVKNDYVDFTGNEYLQIYPYIEYLGSGGYIKNLYKSSGAYVVFPSVNGNDKIVSLADWLRSR